MSDKQTWITAKGQVILVACIVFLFTSELCIASDPSKPTKEMLETPVYDSTMWLNHSLAMTDLVVVGKPHLSPLPNKSYMNISKVLYGAIHKDQQLTKKQLKLFSPSQFTKWTLDPTGGRPKRIEQDIAGVWILLRTPKGYFSINPSSEPLKQSEWNKVFNKLADKNPRHKDIIESYNDDRTELRRSSLDSKTGRKKMDGVTVQVSRSRILTSLFKSGDLVFTREQDVNGRLKNIRQFPRTGKGYEISYRYITPWHYTKTPSYFYHYLNGKKEGVSRDFSFSKNKEGLLKEELYWHNGVKNGSAKTWDNDGKLISEELYENGLISPVIDYKGKNKTSDRKTSMNRSEEGVVYTAHRKITNAIKVGMSTDEISQIIKAPFSEKSGIRFLHYDEGVTVDISFKDGKVAERKESRNRRYIRVNK